MIRPPSTGRRARVDAAVAAYMQRHERDAVRTCRAWNAAIASGESLVVGEYQTALDHEERAAKTCAGLITRICHLAETGLADQLAWLHFNAGASRR